MSDHGDVTPAERALDAAARALPRDVAPPPDLLARVQAEIGERRARGEAALDAAARALPRDIAPPDALLARVQGALPRDRALPSRPAVGSAHTAPPGRADHDASRPALARRERRFLAAALLLIGAMGGTVVTVVWQRGTARQVAVGAGASPAAPAAAASAAAAPDRSSAATLVANASPFASYERAAADLAALLAERRGGLRPETVKVLEQSLQQIDAALADVRAALARDPASDALRDVVRRLYDQKLDLLKRSTALSST